MPVLQRDPAQAAARLFHGFADPTRMAILQALLGGERCVRDLVAEVERPQSTVSSHLACLKGCGLVEDRPGPGRQVRYRLATLEVATLLRAAEGVLAATGEAVVLCRDPLMGGASDG